MIRDACDVFDHIFNASAPRAAVASAAAAEPTVMSTAASASHLHVAAAAAAEATRMPTDADAPADAPTPAPAAEPTTMTMSTAADDAPPNTFGGSLGELDTQLYQMNGKPTLPWALKILDFVRDNHHEAAFSAMSVSIALVTIRQFLMRRHKRNPAAVASDAAELAAHPGFALLADAAVRFAPMMDPDDVSHTVFSLAGWCKLNPVFKAPGFGSETRT